MKKKQIIIGMAIAFTFLVLVSSFSTTAKASNPLWLMQVLMPNAVYATESRNDNQNLIVIINRDVALVYINFLNGSTENTPASDGFAFIYPLSKIFNLAEWLLGGFLGGINVDSIRVAGTFNSYFEMYNDTNEDSVLTIIRNSTLNSTEATHLLIPMDYDNVYHGNLTPQSTVPQFLDVGAKPNLYVWNVSYQNVQIGVFNATFNEAGNHDMTWLANDSLAWVNYSYAYIFDTSNAQWQLNRSITLGAYNDVSEEGFYINKSIATVHTHAAARVNVVSSPTVTNNASVEYNNTETLNASYLDFSISSENMGRWDMTETKAEYTVDDTPYNATSCGSPVVTVSAALNITNDYFYQGNIDVNITGSVATSRICYNVWNGSVLTHDPFYFLPLLYPEVPLWYAFLPDLFYNDQAAVLLWIIIFLLAALCLIVIVGSSELKNANKKRTQRKSEKNEAKRKEQIAQKRRENLKTARKVKKALNKRKN